MGAYYKTVDVEVEIDVEDVIEDLSAVERRELAARLAEENGAVPFGLGDGDDSRIHQIVERAYAAARGLNNLPREVADLFWYVHGRAI